MSDIDSDYKLLREDVGGVWLRRDVVRASGPDALTYLQGQLSQDVSTLAIGDNALSFLLQPHGKVDALLRVTRTGDDELLIDFDSGYVDVVLERLERFKMRTKVTFEATPHKVLAVRGPGSASYRVEGEPSAAVDWPGMTGFDAFTNEAPAGLQMCDPEAYDALRIEAGIPYMGRELDERTIPAEAGINDRAISFKKGCYTGQELVARIDARGGNVPRRLRGLVVDGTEAPPGGTRVMPAGRVTASTKPLGVLTSAAYSPRLQKVVALAYLRRDVNPPLEGVVDWDEGPLACKVEDLPLA